MISNVEFHVSVGHLYFFLEKCLFSSSAHFLSVFFFFVVVVVGLHELLIYILNTIGKDPDAGKD